MAEDFREAARLRKMSPRRIRTAIRTVSTKSHRAVAHRNPLPRKQLRTKMRPRQEKNGAFRKAPTDPRRCRDKRARDPNPPSGLADVPRTSGPPQTRLQPPVAALTSTSPATSLEPSRKRASQATTETPSDEPATRALRATRQQSIRIAAPARESPAPGK